MWEQCYPGPGPYPDLFDVLGPYLYFRVIIFSVSVTFMQTLGTWVPISKLGGPY